MLPIFPLAALVGFVSGANFSATVAQHSDLTSLSYYLGLIADFTSTIDKSQNITILAPSNDAFSKVLTQPQSQFSQGKIFGFMDVVLSYHVLNGTWPSSNFGNVPAFIPTQLEDRLWTSLSGSQVVEGYKQNGPVTFLSGQKNQTTVKTPDIPFDGGIIHIVDSLLSLPTNVTDTTAALNMPIATKILSNRDFANGVDGALNDITIFIVSDKVVGPQSGNIFQESPSDFNKVLGYHLIVGHVLYSPGIKNGQFATYTNDNENVTMRVIGNDIYVNQAKIIERDILVNAGVGHVIDAPLQPGNFSLPPPIASANASTSPTPVPSSTSAPTSATAAPSQTSSASDSSLSAGAYAGIGVGSAVGASAIVAIIVLLCLRSRKHQQESDRSHESFDSQNPIRSRRTQIAKELPSEPLDSSTRQELASDMEKYENSRHAELDSKTIMSQIPQDIYMTRAELGAERLRHPAYGTHASINDHPLKRG